MTVALVQSTEWSEGTTTAALVLPAAPTAGNLLVVAAGGHASGSNTPSKDVTTGWTAAGGVQENNSGLRVWFKTADGTETANGVTWPSASSRLGAGVYEYSGVTADLYHGRGSSTFSNLYPCSATATNSAQDFVICFASGFYDLGLSWYWEPDGSSTATGTYTNHLHRSHKTTSSASQVANGQFTSQQYGTIYALSFGIKARYAQRATSAWSSIVSPVHVRRRETGRWVTVP